MKQKHVANWSGIWKAAAANEISSEGEDQGSNLKDSTPECGDPQEVYVALCHAEMLLTACACV